MSRLLFCKRKTTAQLGRISYTLYGANIQIPACNTPTFKASNTLKDKIN